MLLATGEGDTSHVAADTTMLHGACQHDGRFFPALIINSVRGILGLLSETVDAAAGSTLKLLVV